MERRILLVDDDHDIRNLLATVLASKGYEVRAEENVAGFRTAMQEEEFSLLLLDLQLPDGSGIEMMQEAHASDPHLPAIIITAHGSVEQAVEAMRQGAYDFSPKPVDMQRLAVSVKNAIENYQLRRTVSSLEQTRKPGLVNLVGSSQPMQMVYRIIQTVAKSKAAVMVTGESGTGKELVAQAIHKLSPRAKRDLIDVNCAAIPKDLLESELFGHEKSAFTGATERSIGRCERAHQSTLFLDEITEMDILMQPKLLRFLEEHAITRVGGKDKIPVDIRLVSATNREPEQAIDDGKFREDLYYRLNVVTIPLPSLRDRIEDVPELAQHFLTLYAEENEKEFSSLADSTLDLLCSYSWPGNVRELRNCIQQGIVLHEGDTLLPEMIPQKIRDKASVHIPAPREPSADAPREDHIIPFSQIEKDAIERALRITKGNVAQASAGLHLSQATLYRKIRDYEIDLQHLKEAE